MSTQDFMNFPKNETKQYFFCLLIKHGGLVEPNNQEQISAKQNELRQQKQKQQQQHYHLKWEEKKMRA
jgi:hypothetical protein